MPISSTWIEMLTTGKRVTEQASKRESRVRKREPPLVTALTAPIINGFFIRNCRSLNLPRDLNRSLKLRKTNFEAQKT